MTAYNKQLVAAGVTARRRAETVSAGSCAPVSGPGRTTVEGSFDRPNELIASWRVWHVKSIGGAVEGVRKRPNRMPGESEIEIRPFI